MSEVASLRSVVRNDDGSFSVSFACAGRTWNMRATPDDEGLEVEFDDELADAMDLIDQEEDGMAEDKLVLREIGLIADAVMESLASSGLLGDLGALEDRFDEDWDDEGESEPVQA